MKKNIIVPLDHGVHDGPIVGLTNIEPLVYLLKEEDIDATVLHKGVARYYSQSLRNLPFYLHLSASSCMGVWLRKVLVSSLDDAENLGAYGISVHVNMGNPYEPEMLKDLGSVASECIKRKFPLLAMMYIRDDSTPNYTDVSKVKHAARVAFELGASIVKVPFTGSKETFEEVVEGCPIPIVMAGGTVDPNEKILLKAVEDVMAAGASGTSIGRGIFQHKDPRYMIKEIKNRVYP